jgi:MYXO-CTERM domain-containing protein
MGRTLLVLIGLVACALPDAPALGETEQEMAVCADGPTVYGIDVSRFQGTIDWQQVKDSGVVYAYIQISRSVTDLDAKFEYNWRRAKEVGILRGAYQRFQPDQDVALQAQIFLDKLGPYQVGDLPPMLDVEDDGGLTGPQIADRVKQWMERVEPVVGVTPLIYTGFYFWRDVVGGADLSRHPLWIANYGATCPLVPQAWSRWTLHQYSSTAQIPGITENTVDVNKFNGTLEQLKALGQPVEPAACPPISPTEPTIIDDSSGCFSSGGPAQYIRSEPAGHGGSLKWTHATDSATAANFGTWKLEVGETGRYLVEAHTPAPFNESKRAVYRVSHDGTTTEAMVDQSAVDGWNPVGEFTFAAGGMQSIRVDDNTGEPNASETMIVFDAVRLTPMPGDSELAGVGSGCATGSTDLGLVAGVLGLALVRRRRRCR